MTDAPKNVEDLARTMLGAAQRMAMQIAALPLDKRDEGFSLAERCLQNAVREKGITGKRMEGFIKIQMDAIRGMGNEHRRGRKSAGRQCIVYGRRGRQFCLVE
jgi:hypothetical protein